jgi:hypothetical protein
MIWRAQVSQGSLAAGVRTVESCRRCAQDRHVGTRCLGATVTEPTRIGWDIDAAGTRTLLDELIRLHDADGVMDLEDATDKELASIVWPLGHQVFRFAKAALALVDADLAHEAHVFLRTGIEYTITAHYLVERADVAGDLWLAAQAVQADKTLNWSMETFDLDFDTRRGAEALASACTEQTAVDSFHRICEELSLDFMYGWWALESAFVHPTSATQNSYFDPVNLVLLDEAVTAPGDPDAVRQLYCLLLLWMSSALDKLRDKPKHVADLNAVAILLDRPPQLGPPVPKPAGYGPRPPRKWGWKAAEASGKEL